MKKAYVIVTLALFLMPFVLAYDTPITITTNSNSFVMIRVFEGNNRLNLLQSVFDRRVDFNNQVKITHTSEFSTIDIEVYIKNEPNGDTQHYKKFERVTAGRPFNATVPEDATLPTPTALATETQEVTSDTQSSNETTNTTTTSPATITGNVVQSSNSLAKIPWYYIVAGVLLAGVLVAGGFMVKEKKFTKGHATMPKSPPGSDKNALELQQKLQETQARLDQATKEIARIKNEDQIKQLQKNIDAEQEQIRKLQQGYS